MKARFCAICWAATSPVYGRVAERPGNRVGFEIPRVFPPRDGRSIGPTMAPTGGTHGTEPGYAHHVVRARLLRDRDAGRPDHPSRPLVRQPEKHARAGRCEPLR